VVASLARPSALARASRSSCSAWGAGLVEQRLSVGLGLAGYPLRRSLRPVKHVRGVVVVILLTGRRWWPPRREGGFCRGRGGVDRTEAWLWVTLRELGAQSGVVLQQPGQFGLYQLEEGIHFVFVIAPLADRRLTEGQTAQLRWG
jgi:hypothetical protein